MRADLTFIRFTANPPMADITGAASSKLDRDVRQVELADADAQLPAPTLASHGFETVPFSAALPEAGVNEAYAKYFTQLCGAAIKRQTGAALVVGLPATVQVRRSNGEQPVAPLVVSHTDFTPTSATRRAANFIASLKTKRRPSRFAAFNAWWLAREGPQDRPLALCDPNTISPADLQFGRVQVLGQNKKPVDFGEIAYQRYSARNRWFWYPNLGPDRLLLFCGFDSDSSRPSMVTHCAFTNPECPPDAPPRVSVECRLLAFW